MSYLDQLRRHIGADHKDPSEYVCTGCDAGFDRRRQVCPECGGYAIRRREWRPIQ